MSLCDVLSPDSFLHLSIIILGIQIEDGAFVIHIDGPDPSRILPDDVPERDPEKEIVDDRCREQGRVAPSASINGNHDLARVLTVFVAEGFDRLRRYERMVGQANENACRRVIKGPKADPH